MVEPQNSSGSQIKIPKDTGRDTTFLPDVVLFALAGFIVPALLALGFALGNEMQVVAIGMAVLGVVLIMARPFWGLLFFVALLYARPEEVIPALAGMHFTLAISLVTLTGMVFKLCLDRSMLVRTPLIGMMLGFCCAMGLSGLVGGTTGAAIMDGGRLVMLVVLIVNLCRTPARYQALVINRGSELLPRPVFHLPVFHGRGLHRSGACPLAGHGHLFGS